MFLAMGNFSKSVNVNMKDFTSSQGSNLSQRWDPHLSCWYAINDWDGDTPLSESGLNMCFILVTLAPYMKPECPFIKILIVIFFHICRIEKDALFVKWMVWNVSWTISIFLYLPLMLFFWRCKFIKMRLITPHGSLASLTMGCHKIR